MFRFLKITFRNIIKDKAFSLINIGGLIIGITCFLLISIWVRFENGFEKYNPNSKDVFRIIYTQKYADQLIHSAVSPAPLGPALTQEYPEVNDYTRYSIFFGEVLLSNEEQRHYEENGAYADPGFFDMFSVEFIEGDQAIALEDPYSIVLTESLAKKYFPDANPINEILHLESFAPLKVTGIIKDNPRNTHLQFDFLVPYILMEKWGTNINDWNTWGHQYTYIQIQENANPEKLESTIKNYLDKHSPQIPGELSLQNIEDIHLDTSLNYDNYSVLRDKIIVNIFMLIAIVVLMIACLNFINLTTAQYINRTKESSIRKIVGANRSRLIFQYLLESILISFTALHISLVFIELLRTKVEFLSANKLMLSFNDPWTYFILIAIWLTTGVLSGLYPAIMISSFNPLSVLKGKSIKRKGAVSTRKMLVIVQFVLASCMLIISIYAYKQLAFINNKDVGYSSKDIIAVQLRGNMSDKFEVFKTELLENQDITHVSYGSSFTTINASTADELTWRNKPSDASFEVFSSSIDFDYLEMFEIEIKHGRSFSENFPTDEQSAFILNETAVEALELKDPIDEQITYMGREGQVIGVAKDYNFSTLYQEIQPLIISIQKGSRFFMFVKINPGAYESTLKFINDKWNVINPQFPFKYDFVSDAYASSYDPFNKSIRLILNFTIVTIIIALMGLYALTSFITISRTKEIGIRKVLGASVKTILLLLNRDFLILIGIAFIIAIPISYFAIDNWMQLFAYKLDINPFLYLQSGLLIAFVAIVTISIQVINLAFKNPIESLRYE